MSNLRKRIAMIIEAEEGQDTQTNQAAEQLEQQFGDCKNLHGKISPFIIIAKRHSSELEGMQSTQQMIDFVEAKMNEYNTMFKNAGVSSDVYDATSSKYMAKMKTNMRKYMNKPSSALQYLFNALLAGDGLAVSASVETDGPTLDISAVLGDKAKMKYLSEMLAHLSK